MGAWAALPWRTTRPDCALSVISHQVTAGTVVDGTLSAISPAMLHGLMRMELSLGRVGYAMLTHQREMTVHNARRMSNKAADRRRHPDILISMRSERRLGWTCEE
jgi:hypothetical protein